MCMRLYDWRQDNRISACELKDEIQVWRELHPGEQVWIMGHSNGGILARWYIEEGGSEIVSRRSRHCRGMDHPAPSIYCFTAWILLLRVRFNLFDIPRRTRETLRTFPPSRII